MAIRVMTLFNKPDYVQTAIECVRQQTRECVHHVMSDVCQDWGDKFPPSYFVNNQWKAADPGDYLIWLSDDDYWMPEFAETLAGFLDDNPEQQACYTASRHILYDIKEGETGEIRVLGGEHHFYDRWRTPQGMIDGGQVMVRRSALDRIEYPWQPETWDDSRYCDAHYLQKLANAYGIHPTGTMLMESRTTPVSMHTRKKGNTYGKTNWWEVR